MSSISENFTKIEFERKFLVKFHPDLVTGSKKVAIEQGFLSYRPLEVRLRQTDRSHFTMTIKGEGKDIFRSETEIEINDSQFRALWPLTAGRRILKTRHLIQHKETTIELDVFHGSNSGLVIAEVEFLSEDELKLFQAPEWFDKEITGDSGYHNLRLAVD